MRLPTSIKRIVGKDFFPFIIFALYLLAFHIPVNTDFGDDLFGRRIWSEGRVFSWFIENWHNWSSRGIINFTGTLFSYLPQAIWKIFNIFFMVLAAVCVSGIFVGGARGGDAPVLNDRDNDDPPAASANNRRAVNFIVVALFLMYNLYEMSSSGWISATIGYMWPAACGLYVMLSVKKICLSEKIRRYEYPLILAALIFAVNHEQLCAVLLAVYLYYIIRCAVRYKTIRQGKERVSCFILVQIFISLASLTNILICPGNSLRYAVETARFFPGHDALTLFEKISIGFSSTLNYFVMTPNLPFIALLLLLAVGIFARYKNPWTRVASIVPLLVYITAVLYVLFDLFIVDGTFVLKNPRDIFHLYGIIGKQEGANFYVPHILYAAMMCSFTVSLYLLFKGTGKFMFLFSVLSLGIASRVMMGLAPSVFASSYRTYLLLNISFIITSAVVYQYIAATVMSKTLRYINMFIYIAAIVNCLTIPVGYQIVKPFFNR